MAGKQAELPPRQPAECFPPGEFIREELEARGWSADAFAEMIAWNRDTLEAILERNEPITREQARAIAQGFGTSAAFWTNLQTAYRRWLGRVRFGGAAGFDAVRTAGGEGQG